MSAEQEIQALCETYLGRKFTGADQKLLRKFLSDLQRQKVDDDADKPRDTKPEIITKPWENRKEPERGSLADSPVQPMVRADSKLFNRVESWAHMAAEANKQPEPKRDAPVAVSPLGTADGVSQRTAKYTQVAEALSPRGNRPADLPQAVGIKDRLGKWKNAEEGKGAIDAKPIPKSAPADLPVEVDMSNRLGKWKNAEEGKTEAKPVQKTGPADLPVEVDMSNRLGKWKSAEEGKGAVDAKPIQKTGPADLPVEVDIGNRLGKWKEAEEGKHTETNAARKAPIVIKVATEDGEEQVVQAAQVKDRLNTYVKVAEDSKPAAGHKAVEEVQEAPKLKDRLQHYNRAAEEKQVEKVAIVVPYDDDYEAPAFPGEGEPAPASAVKPATYKRPIDEVAEAPKLKDRLKALEHAAEERTIEKAPIVVPYDDGYEAPAIGEEHHESAPIRRDPVKIEGGSSLKDRLNSWSEATVEKPVPKTAIDIPDPEDD